MKKWYAKQLGDAILAYEAIDQIQQMFPTFYVDAGQPADMAIFTRHELEGRLQCEMLAYFSPAAETIARQLGAQACGKPGRAELELLAGESDCWAILFTEEQ